MVHFLALLLKELTLKRIKSSYQDEKIKIIVSYQVKICCKIRGTLDAYNGPASIIINNDQLKNVFKQHRNTKVDFIHFNFFWHTSLFFRKRFYFVNIWIYLFVAYLSNIVDEIASLVFSLVWFWFRFQNKIYVFLNIVAIVVKKNWPL